MTNPTFRCKLCGGIAGMSVTEATENGRTQHGVGVCVSPCRYCNEGVMHARGVCANVQEGRPLPQLVREFEEYHNRRDQLGAALADVARLQAPDVEWQEGAVL